MNQRHSDLDAIRAFAVLSVMLYHYTSRYLELGFDTNMHAGVGYYFSWGASGVELFFVLSGYLMSASASKYSVSEFITKRWARLWPAYVFCLTITFIAKTYFPLPGREVDFLQYLVNISMFQTLFLVKHVDGAYWSLFVELIFYIFVAFYIFVYKYKNGNQFINYIYCTALIAAAITAAAVFSGFIDNRVVEKIAEYLSYIPLFAIGVVSSGEKNTTSRIYICSLYIIYMYLLVLQNGLGVRIFSVGFLVSMMTLYLQYRDDIPRVKIPKFVVKIGLISYPMYLLHQDIGYIMLRYVSNYTEVFFFQVVVVVAFVVVLSILVSKFIENIAVKYLGI